MAERITDAVPSETSLNDIRIAVEGLIISSDLEGNDKRKAFARLTCFIYTKFLFLLLITIVTSNVNFQILMQYIGTLQKLWSLM